MMRSAASGRHERIFPLFMGLVRMDGVKGRLSVILFPAVTTSAQCAAPCRIHFSHIVRMRSCSCAQLFHAAFAHFLSISFLPSSAFAFITSKTVIFPCRLRRLKPGPVGSFSRLFHQFHVRDLYLPSGKPALDGQVQTHQRKNGGDGSDGSSRMLCSIGIHAQLMVEKGSICPMLQAVNSPYNSQHSPLE